MDRPSSDRSDRSTRKGSIGDRSHRSPSTGTTGHRSHWSLGTVNTGHQSPSSGDTGHRSHRSPGTGNTSHRSHRSPGTGNTGHRSTIPGAPVRPVKPGAKTTPGLPVLSVATGTSVITGHTGQKALESQDTQFLDPSEPIIQNSPVRPVQLEHYDQNYSDLLNSDSHDDKADESPERAILRHARHQSPAIADTGHTGLRDVIVVPLLVQEGRKRSHIRRGSTLLAAAHPLPLGKDRSTGIYIRRRRNTLSHTLRSVISM